MIIEITSTKVPATCTQVKLNATEKPFWKDESSKNGYGISPTIVRLYLIGKAIGRIGAPLAPLNFMDAAIKANS